MNRIPEKVSTNSEYSQAELRSQINLQTRSGNVAETVSCGHHYFNPQWVYQDQTTPSLMYNDAVYFTVSDDGTHYFHQSFKGEFYPVYPSTMETKSRRPKTSHPRISGNEHYNRNSANWANHRQISLNQSWYAWKNGNCPSKQSQLQGAPKRKDVRSTIVPMFPEAFSFGSRESSGEDELLDDILSNKKIGIKLSRKRPGKLR